MAKAPAKFKSSFLLLDVKTGRKALAKQMARGEKVRVLIEATIDAQASGDDGVSIEFSAEVHSVQEITARKPSRRAA